MPSAAIRLYRSTLRELRLNDTVHRYVEHRKTSPVLGHLRTMFVSASPNFGQDPSSKQLVELAAFLRANRLHQALLERYNGGLDMTQEERSRLTARRVGLNMPKEYDPESSGTPPNS